MDAGCSNVIEREVGQSERLQRNRDARPVLQLACDFEALGEVIQRLLVLAQARRKLTDIRKRATPRETTLLRARASERRDHCTVSEREQTAIEPLESNGAAQPPTPFATV